MITLCAEEALARAQEAVGGPLAGVPLLVKDVFDTAGIRTTAGSRIFAERVPRTSAATVRTLEAAGAIVLAKTNCDEFAWGVTGQNYFYGDCGNRGDPAESPAARAAATPPGWPPGWRRWRSEATPAARCGCRPRAARWEG